MSLCECEKMSEADTNKWRTEQSPRAHVEEQVKENEKRPKGLSQPNIFQLPYSLVGRK